MSLVLKKDQYRVLKDWLESHYPNEACGFFSGLETPEGGREIEELWPVENQSTENQQRRFVIGALDYLKAERKVETDGSNLLGVFHSHPDHPAQPSTHDLASAQPYFSYVIASVHDGTMGDVRSFRLYEGEFIEEQVIIQQ